MNLSILLSAFGVTLYSISFLTSFTMIILICCRISQLKSNVAICLILNTYFNCFLISSMMLMLYSYTLLGNLDSSQVFDGQWCRWRVYFVHVCFSSLFYSFVLQATFRLFRIVFYRLKILQSFGIFLLAFGIQWILSFLSILPNLLLDDFQYQTNDFNCWISFENLRGLILAIIIIYNNPLSIIFTIYTQIIRYTRRQVNQIQQRRKNANQRDLAVLKRILILVFTVVGIGLPTIIVILIYMIKKEVVPYAYHIQGLSIACGVFISSLCLVFLTPQLQNLFYRNQSRIQPHQTLVMTINADRLNPNCTINTQNDAM